MSDIRWVQRFDNYEKAYSRLQEAIKLSEEKEQEVKRFKITSDSIQKLRRLQFSAQEPKVMPVEVQISISH